jgi:hypothetical protein
MNSRVVCIVKGDENRKFFHNFVDRRKRVDTIWE